MILKALYDYYHRSGDNVAPLGLEYKEIGFIIVIDKDGNLCRIEDNPVKKLVAKTKEKRSKYANRRECVFFIWVGRKG